MLERFGSRWLLMDTCRICWFSRWWWCERSDTGWLTGTWRCVEVLHSQLSQKPHRGPEAADVSRSACFQSVSEAIFRSWRVTCVVQILLCAVCSLDLHQDLLAAVSSQQLEDQLYTGLMGNAKVEYHPRIRCLQWLNVTHMDENSFWDVYLYRLYSIILYWDPDYTNKQETKQEKQPKPMWGLWSQCFGYRRQRRWKIGTRNLAHFWKVLTFLWCLFFFCSCLKHTKRQREAPFANLRLVHVHDVKFWNKEAVILMTEKINPSYWFVSCTVLSFLSVFFKFFCFVQVFLLV